MYFPSNVIVHLFEIGTKNPRDVNRLHHEDFLY